MKSRLVCAIAGATLVLGAADVPAQGRSVELKRGPVAVERIADGLCHPWGMAFLPDGRMLVTERPGDLRIVTPDGAVSEPVPGTPEVFSQGQGGLMDVALDPDFAQNRTVYLSFAEPGEGGASTALGRGRLVEDRIEGFEVIFRQEPKVGGGNHFGNRIVVGPDGKIFLAMGERFKFDPAQDLSNHLGTIVRLNRDGSVPPDNPFVGRADAEKAIWSYGHRNIEAAAIDPDSGDLWIGEMGPRGGDELNRIRAGANYGWPLVSWGKHYNGEDIPDPDTRPEFAAPVHHWTPVISPSGMIFYSGELFPEWKGHAFLGGLTTGEVVRVAIEDGKVVDEERIAIGNRVREVEQGPDGAIYVLTDEEDGELLRLAPSGQE